MSNVNKLSATIFSITAAGTFSHLTYAQNNDNDKEEIGPRITELVVSASKREAVMQEIPIAMQAMGKDTLSELNVSSFSDYVKYLPNVNFAGRGPGQNYVYIRGVSTDQVAPQSAEVAGTAPNVALYLDEAPVTATARNLDVYVTDMARVEVLAGPQGTLFGSSSQAGTVRLITNKPDVGLTSAGFQANVSTTRYGDLSNGIEGYVNFPIIENKLAARLTVYDVNYGGYIDNKAGTLVMPASNPRIQDGTVPDNATLKVRDNANFVEDDFNDSYYTGARLGLFYVINDNWDFLLQTMTQELGTDGVFDYDPEIGDLEVQRSFNDELVDEFNHTSWTLQGRMGVLDLLYTGSYLDRDVDQSIDYSGYANIGPYIPYYICEYPSYSSCEAPVLGYSGVVENERTTHEFRVSTDPTLMFSFVGGVFYDDVEVVNRGNFIYEGATEVGFGQNAPVSGASNSDPNPRPPGVVFFNDITRTEEQLAVFGELTYLINSNFSATLGLRYYDIDLEMVGSSNGFLRGEDTDAGINLDEVLSPSNESGTVGKLTLNYTPNLDTLFYVTVSEGFRPGGFNRRPTPIVPESFESDEVLNYEFGWKSTLLGGSLQVNGNIYRIYWNDIQTGVFDPGEIEDGGSGSNIVFTVNAGEAEITGLEADFTYLPTDYITLAGAISFNDSELVDKPDEADNIVDEGSDLAMTPTFQGNVRARYHFDVNELNAYFQLAALYKGDNFSSIIIGERFEMESYSTFDASVGMTGNAWQVELFAENITDERAELFISNMDDIPRIVTNRPRTLGLKLSYDF